MTKTIYQVLFLSSPLLLVAVAQGLCMKYGWLTALRKPLDLGKSLGGRRIFGDHKTFRGFFINMVFCVLGTLVQAGIQNIAGLPSWLALIDYREHWLLLGTLIGLGMTIGELPNSFLKRRLDISPGKKRPGLGGLCFFLWDQVDLTIGIWICIFWLVNPTVGLVLWSFLLTILLHVSISTIGYLLGMRKTIV